MKQENVTIVNLTYRYMQPDDLCRTPLITFRTRDWSNDTVFELYFVVMEYGEITRKRLYRNCQFYMDRPGYGYCTAREMDLVHYKDTLWTLKQILPDGQTWNSKTYSIKLNFIGIILNIK